MSIALPETSMRNRFIVLVAGMLVLTIAWYFVAYHPARTKLTKVRADVVTSQQQVAQLQAELTRLQGLERNAGNLRKQAAKFATALPAIPKVSDFIVQVQDAANAAGIDFLSIAPSLPAAATTAAAAAPAAAPAATPAASPIAGSTAPTPAPGAAVTPAAPVPALQAISLSITAKAKFFPLEQFILKLEHLQRAVRINTFGISSSTANGATDLSVTLNAQMFVLPGTTIPGGTK